MRIFTFHYKKLIENLLSNLGGSGTRRERETKELKVAPKGALEARYVVVGMSLEGLLIA
jgi:hypothetical protein